MSAVVCSLPKAGLGNQLFSLMKALAFAQLNAVPAHVTGYHQIKLGPYLRNEKNKRRYGDFFTFEKSIICDSLVRMWMEFPGREIVNEPPLEVMRLERRALYVFSQIPHWGNLFDGLREYRPLVRRLLSAVVKPQVHARLEQLTRPCIGIHVRMGDFRRPTAGEDFDKVGAVRTPERYFIDVIGAIRALSGRDLPVSIFTDGRREEFQLLGAVPSVRFVEGNSDLVDLLLLSRSKIIVASAGSTFSYWAGFLSDAPLIMHPGHIHRPIRTTGTCTDLYEGPMTVSNESLALQIRNL